MSLARRLYNLARAELQDAARRIANSKGHERSAWDSDEDRARRLTEDHPFEEDPRRRDSTDTGRSKTNEETEEPEEIRRFYANLELPVGASKDEVKAAYRSMMRRYHPDRHQGDPAREEVATKLALELRAAYEGLMGYLEGRASEESQRRR